MSRITQQYFAVAVGADGEPFGYRSTDPITAEIMSEIQAGVFVQIHHGYDISTDSAWPSFRHETIPLEKATQVLRQWNRDNPGWVVPSIEPL